MAITILYILGHEKLHWINNLFEVLTFILDAYYQTNNKKMI